MVNTLRVARIRITLQMSSFIKNSLNFFAKLYLKGTMKKMMAHINRIPIARKDTMGSLKLTTFSTLSSI